jgi:hypothetical protein
MALSDLLQSASEIREFAAQPGTPTFSVPTSLKRLIDDQSISFILDKSFSSLNHNPGQRKKNLCKVPHQKSFEIIMVRDIEVAYNQYFIRMEVVLLCTIETIFI